MCVGGGLGSYFTRERIVAFYSMLASNVGHRPTPEIKLSLSSGKDLSFPIVLTY